MYRLAVRKPLGHRRSAHNVIRSVVIRSVAQYKSQSTGAPICFPGNRVHSNRKLLLPDPTRGPECGGLSRIDGRQLQMPIKRVR